MEPIHQNGDGLLLPPLIGTNNPRGWTTFFSPGQSPHMHLSLLFMQPPTTPFLCKLEFSSSWSTQKEPYNQPMNTWAKSLTVTKSTLSTITLTLKCPNSVHAGCVVMTVVLACRAFIYIHTFAAISRKASTTLAVKWTQGVSTGWLGVALVTAQQTFIYVLTVCAITLEALVTLTLEWSRRVSAGWFTVTLMHAQLALIFVFAMCAITRKAGFTMTLEWPLRVTARRILAADVSAGWAFVYILTRGIVSHRKSSCRKPLLARTFERSNCVVTERIFTTTVTTQRTLIHIFTCLALSTVAIFTRTPKGPGGVNAIRVCMTGMSQCRTFIHIHAVVAISTVPRSTKTLKWPNGVNAIRVCMTDMSQCRTFIHIHAVVAISTVPRSTKTLKWPNGVNAICVSRTVMTRCAFIYIHTLSAIIFAFEAGLTLACKWPIRVSTSCIDVAIVLLSGTFVDINFSTFSRFQFSIPRLAITLVRTHRILADFLRATPRPVTTSTSCTFIDIRAWQPVWIATVPRLTAARVRTNRILANGVLTATVFSSFTFV